MDRPRLAALLAISVLATACGMVAPSSGGVDPDRAITRASCGGASFPIELIEQPGSAESADDPAAEALRRHLATEGPDVEWLPDAGWREAVRTDGSVLFIADAPPGDGPPLVEVSASRQADGWTVTGWGQCWPRADVGPELGPAEFRVAPGEELAADMTEIDVLVTERACTGAQDARGRIVRPAVIASADAVIVVFAVQPLEGEAFTCPSNPETPFLLELPEALGDRLLMDGSSVPPRDATTCPDIAVCP